MRTAWATQGVRDGWLVYMDGIVDVGETSVIPTNEKFCACVWMLVICKEIRVRGTSVRAKCLALTDEQNTECVLLALGIISAPRH